MATIDIGKIKPVFKGTYDNSTAYVLDDIVYYNGSSYVAKTSTTGNLPTDNTKWNILASGSGGVWDSTLSIGSAGQVVKVNSGATALEFGDASAGLQSIQKFTANGTYTKPAGISKVKVIVTGGGGGGGGGNPGYNARGGGGAGGTAIKIVDVSSISTVAVTVGNGGTAGSANGGGDGGNGTAGGTSSFGSHASATGGYGGNVYVNPTSFTRGVGSSGDLNITGGDGTQYEGGGSSTDEGGSTTGGASFWGGGGMGDGGGGSFAGGAGQSYGSGGGGGQHDGTGSSAGGAGKHGIVYVEEYA